VWQQKKNIPKDSENWFAEWYPSANQAVKVVCFISAAYLKSPYCMKEFRVAQGMDKLLVVACEPVQAIRAVDPTAHPHASDALAYLLGGGQVIFHDADDVEAEIMKFIVAGAGAQPEPEPAATLSTLGQVPAAASPLPGIKTLADFVAAVAEIDDIDELLECTAEEMADILEENAAALKGGTLGKKQRRKLLEEHARGGGGGSAGGDVASEAVRQSDQAQAAAATAEAARVVEAQRKQVEEQAEALRRQQSAIDRQLTALQAEQEAAKAAAAKAVADEVAEAKRRAEDEAASLALQALGSFKVYVSGANWVSVNGEYEVDTQHGLVDGVPCYRLGRFQTITRRDGRWWIDHDHGGDPYYCVRSTSDAPPESGWCSDDCQPHGRPTAADVRVVRVG
jgi:hypothetical protein